VCGGRLDQLASHRDRLPEHLRPAVAAKKSKRKSGEIKLKKPEFFKALPRSPPKSKPSLAAPPTPSPRAAAQKRSVESDAEVTVKAEATQATQSSASRVRIPKKPRREPKAEPL
jgi:hypothetical protein